MSVNKTLAALVLASSVAATAAPPAFANREKGVAILKRFLPARWRGTPRVTKPAAATTREAGLRPAAEEASVRRKLIPRGGVEYTTAIESLAADAQRKFGSQVGHADLERLARESVDEIWPTEGIAITTFVGILAEKQLRQRLDGIKPQPSH
jgi:hypothetical protein